MLLGSSRIFAVAAAVAAASPMLYAGHSPIFFFFALETNGRNRVVRLGF